MYLGDGATGRSSTRHGRLPSLRFALVEFGEAGRCAAARVDAEQDDPLTNIRQLQDRGHLVKP
jgi:hypothetical protein